jgi:hypothetical protein
MARWQATNRAPSIMSRWTKSERPNSARDRAGSLRYEVCGTPDEVRCGVVAYLRAFGLIFGAFDFSVTPEGRWWFLECNPAGQWGWLTEETGLPIAEAIADELVRAA